MWGDGMVVVLFKESGDGGDGGEVRCGCLREGEGVRDSED